MEFSCWWQECISGLCVCAREQENGRRTGREPNGENEKPKNRTSPTKRTERQLPFERMRTFSKPFRCAFELRLDERWGQHTARRGNSRSRTKKRCAAQNASDRIAGLTAAVAASKRPIVRERLDRPLRIRASRQVNRSASEQFNATKN